MSYVPVTFFLFLLLPAQTGTVSLREEALGAVRKACDFFSREVSTEGGYLWRYSADLARREGERAATRTMVWVQPPGTPSVGMTFLRAYEVTGDRYYLELARRAAGALVRGQLRSGGWEYHIEFDPEKRKEYAYRVDGRVKGRNTTTLDDNTTQAAVRLLMRVDRALEFKDSKIHEAVQYALSALLKAQYPNGAWPQRYQEFPDASRFPVKRAAYPAAWGRLHPSEQDYRGFYTFNDNSIADMIETMLEAGRIYADSRYTASARKGGDFILLAQMPEPQPAWAQQYDTGMHPAWARRFEPPAVTGGESQGVMRTLLLLYRESGDRRYLEPLPRALQYLERSRLPDGSLARFYELQTNRPLYFTRDYQLTYSDKDLPTHYGFKVPDRTAGITEEYQRLRRLGPDELKALRKDWRPRLEVEYQRSGRAEPEGRLADRVRAIVTALDERGRWVEPGRLRAHGPDSPVEPIIDSRTFVENVEILCAYQK